MFSFLARGPYSPVLQRVQFYMTFLMMWTHGVSTLIRLVNTPEPCLGLFRNIIGAVDDWPLSGVQATSPRVAAQTERRMVTNFLLMLTWPAMLWPWFYSGHNIYQGTCQKHKQEQQSLGPEPCHRSCPRSHSGPCKSQVIFWIIKIPFYVNGKRDFKNQIAIYTLK